jgi:hypothetical protein
VISGRPLARRRTFCASIICSTSSTSSWASSSGERVGFQSTCSAPDPGYHLPMARNNRKTTTKAPKTNKLNSSIDEA